MYDSRKSIIPLLLIAIVISVSLACSSTTPTPNETTNPINASTLQPAVESTVINAVHPTETINAALINGTAIVIVESCNIRSGPGTNYEIVGNAKLGDFFRVLGKDSTGEWIQIDQNSESWISASLLKLDSDLSVIEESNLTPVITLTSIPSNVTEWEGVFIGMPADDVLLIHPKAETTAPPEQIGTDNDGLVVQWNYPGAYLVMARRNGSCPEGNDGINCYCYRVIKITLR